MFGRVEAVVLSGVLEFTSPAPAVPETRGIRLHHPFELSTFYVHFTHLHTMSTAAKLTLAATSVATIGTVLLVHRQQKLDKAVGSVVSRQSQDSH